MLESLRTKALRAMPFCRTMMNYYLPLARMRYGFFNSIYSIPRLPRRTSNLPLLLQPAQPVITPAGALTLQAAPAVPHVAEQSLYPLDPPLQTTHSICLGR